MNTVNNKRRKESVEKIEKVFMELLQTKELKEITVSDICKLTGLNRSTFYANFVDIFDLSLKLKEKIETDFSSQFRFGDPENKNIGALRMFTHIKENQIFYKTYFKLGYDESHKIMNYDEKLAEQFFVNKNIEYHIEFFRHGLNAIIKMWLAGGCREAPEEMAEILKLEYSGRKID